MSGRSTTFFFSLALFISPPLLRTPRMRLYFFEFEFLDLTKVGISYVVVVAAVFAEENRPSSNGRFARRSLRVPSAFGLRHENPSV